MISIEGQNIKKIREQKNIGITELAKKAKVGIATISELESGIRKRPSGTTLKKIADALGVSMNDVLGIAEETDYDIVDMEEMFKFLLDANDMEIDGVVLDNEDKKELDAMFKVTIALIREKRSMRK